MNLVFPHPVGLAAGFDKNADYVDALATLGFGFIEIGTVTPKPQPGNQRPRLFRLKDEEALINRMGFNNKGMDYVAKRLEKTQYRGILGINLGKNRDTPLENAIDDYLAGFRALWKYASYFTINISSPNTEKLRNLQQRTLLNELLSTLKKEQQTLAQTQQKYIPLVVKIAPDLSTQEIHDIAHVLLANRIEGVIATNTSIHRDGVQHAQYADEQGGLSGRPLRERATQVVAQLHSILHDDIPIIASGGVMDRNAIQEKRQAGAHLFQIYSGFIYGGPFIMQQLGTF